MKNSGTLTPNPVWGAVAVGAVLFAAAAQSQDLAWLNRSLPPEQRAKLLVAAMTQDEKFQQIVGAPGIIPELPNCYGARHVPGLPRLRIPTLRITNGPVGVGQNDCVPPDTRGLPVSSFVSTMSAKATALPAAIAVGASFDRSVATQFGDVLGLESHNLALNVMEAPGINLARMPQGGRNFEYLGEDPFLAGSMAVAEIRAIQGHGVIAMPKHIVGNDQETDRMSVNAIIDDRVLHELYLLPFEMAAKEGDVAAFMCSYNSVNGSQMCENRHILTDVLRGQWGFKGYIQSDFFAVQGLEALRAGMDHEMPGVKLPVRAPGFATWFTPENLKAALAKGEMAQADIDQALARRYTQMFRMGIFDRPVEQTPIDVARDGALAARIGEQSAVLLKNQGALLPIDAKAVRTIAIIGKAEYASRSVVGGGGSSEVIPYYMVSPLEGMKKTLAALSSPATASLTVVADDNSNLAAAVDAARSADVVIVMAGILSTEGRDLTSINLPKDQDAMITALAAANPHTAVVLKDNAAVLMPWIDSVPAVLEAWFPGQEDGNIVARLLFGIVNPSGKLPVTYPRLETDLPARTPGQFPGLLKDGRRTVTYSEGLQIGYRWFDAQGITPLFPFGHGLSYTTFGLSHLVVTPETSDGVRPIKVQFVVENTGNVAGAEVPQVYLGFPVSAGEPPKRLAAFDKVPLRPGEKRQVELTIDPAAASHPFGIFDSATQTWKTVGGTYQVMVGTSSRNIALSGTVTIANIRSR
jgi:beta-glucosidase